jgi:hypothetical protein
MKVESKKKWAYVPTHGLQDVRVAKAIAVVKIGILIGGPYVRAVT